MLLAFHADRDRRAAPLPHQIDRLARVLARVGQREHPQRQRVRGYQRAAGHIVRQSIVLQNLRVTCSQGGRNLIPLTL